MPDQYTRLIEKEWGQREYIVELKSEEDVYSNSRQIEYSIRNPSPLKHRGVEYTGAHSNSSDTYIVCCRDTLQGEATVATAS